MLKIEITYDGEKEVTVSQQEISADTEQLIKFVEKWQVVASEPCQFGHECEAMKRLLRELIETIGG